MVYKRSENEIKMISKSCQIVADTIDMLSEVVVPGALISDLDKKVLLVDADMRKPQLHKRLGKNNIVGLVLSLEFIFKLPTLLLSKS
mgnify:CR=1 FL=1